MTRDNTILPPDEIWVQFNETEKTVYWSDEKHGDKDIRYTIAPSWNEIMTCKPNREHIELKTQFLVKGFFSIGNTNGDICYQVCRLSDYLANSTKRKN